MLIAAAKSTAPLAGWCAVQRDIVKGRLNSPAFKMCQEGCPNGEGGTTDDEKMSIVLDMSGHYGETQIAFFLERAQRFIILLPESEAPLRMLLSRLDGKMRFVSPHGQKERRAMVPS